MLHPPNLRTAINECEKLGIYYTFKNSKNSHIKFYAGGKLIILSRNNDNPDKVRNHIKRLDNLLRA